MAVTLTKLLNFSVEGDAVTVIGGAAVTGVVPVAGMNVARLLPLTLVPLLLS